MQLIIGTVICHEDDVRIYVKSPFNKELTRYNKQTVLLMLLIPETESEKQLLETIKSTRIKQ